MITFVALLTMNLALISLSVIIELSIIVPIPLLYTLSNFTLSFETKSFLISIIFDDKTYMIYLLCISLLIFTSILLSPLGTNKLISLFSSLKVISFS